MAGEVSAVHEDGELHPAPGSARRSAGGARRTQGFAWSEGRPADRSVASWKDAACELAACGLVAHGERRRVHSSVSGVAPIYYVEHARRRLLRLPHRPARPGPAAPATRSTGAPGRRSSTSASRSGSGPRSWRSSGCGRSAPWNGMRIARSATARQHRWPWAEVEPDLDLDEGAGAVVEAMRAAVAPLAGVRLLHAQRRLGLPSFALPAGRARARRPSGRDGEPGQRPPPRGGVSRRRSRGALGVPHSTMEGEPAAFWDDTRERALRVDFQLAAPPWAMPLAAALRGRPGVATDGLGAGHLRAGGHALLHRVDDPA